MAEKKVKLYSVEEALNSDVKAYGGIRYLDKAQLAAMAMLKVIAKTEALQWMAFMASDRSTLMCFYRELDGRKTILHTFRILGGGIVLNHPDELLVWLRFKSIPDPKDVERSFFNIVGFFNDKSARRVSSRDFSRSICYGYFDAALVENGKVRAWFDPRSNSKFLVNHWLPFATSKADDGENSPITRRGQYLYYGNYVFRYRTPDADLFSQPSKQSHAMKDKPKMEVVKTLAKQEGVKISAYQNGATKGVELKFEEKPAKQVREQIKAAGFRMAYRKGEPYYFAPWNDQNKQVAAAIGRKQIRLDRASARLYKLHGLARRHELNLGEVKAFFEEAQLVAKMEISEHSRNTLGTWMEKLRAAYNKQVNSGKARAEDVIPNPVRKKKQVATKSKAKPKRGPAKRAAKAAPKKSPKAPAKRRARSKLPHGQEKPIKEVGAGDVQEIEFKTVNLPREVGRFLGEIDRNGTAILITGDAGSGKSHLAYQISKCLIDYGLTGKFFSLEEGIGKTSQNKAKKYKLTNALTIVDHSSLEAVHHAATINDFIVIDSWLKLSGVKGTDFDQLRQLFPRTIFVVIFQLTSGGKVRGGSMPKFDAPMVIEVAKDEGDRIALMEKSRYGTANWAYSVFDEKVISENK